MLVLILFILLSSLLKKLLKINYEKGLGNPVLSYETVKFSKFNIKEINGNIISFLLLRHNY
jgi:hypothetical protein